MDLVALRKEQWSGVEWLTHGMRIDPDRLVSLRRKDFAKLRSTYKHKAEKAFLAALESAVMARKASHHDSPPPGKAAQLRYGTRDRKRILRGTSGCACVDSRGFG